MARLGVNMTLDILIPTYNRHLDLHKNLMMLGRQIFDNNLESAVEIIISDNCSPDGTKNTVENFISSNNHLTVQYFRQPENVGLEKNVVDLLAKSTAPFVMFLGDDDYLPDGYILECLNKIKDQPTLGCIIPGLSSLLKDGRLVEGRKEGFEERELNPGFESVWLYSHLGHQMSGLVCRRSGLLEDYLKRPEYRNIYLFIYFVANRLFLYPACYLPKYKVQVTLFNEKDWQYNRIGLLDEVFKSYYPFIEAHGEKSVKKLMMRFTVMHSYRLHIRSLGIRQFFSLYRQIVTSIKPVKGIRFSMLKFFIKEYVAQLRKM